MLPHWPGIRRAQRWWRGFWLASAPRRCCPWSEGHAGRSQTHCQTSLQNSGRCRWSPAWLWRSATSKRSFGRHQPGSRPCRCRKTERHRLARERERKSPFAFCEIFWAAKTNCWSWSCAHSQTNYYNFKHRRGHTLTSHTKSETICTNARVWTGIRGEDACFCTCLPFLNWLYQLPGVSLFHAANFTYSKRERVRERESKRGTERWDKC